VQACYLPPSWNLADYESALDAIGDSFVRGRCSESALRDFNLFTEVPRDGRQRKAVGGVNRRARALPPE